MAELEQVGVGFDGAHQRTRVVYQRFSERNEIESSGKSDPLTFRRHDRQLYTGILQDFIVIFVDWIRTESHLEALIFRSDEISLTVMIVFSRPNKRDVQLRRSNREADFIRLSENRGG